MPPEKDIFPAASRTIVLSLESARNSIRAFLPSIRIFYSIRRLPAVSWLRLHRITRRRRWLLSRGMALTGAALGAWSPRPPR